jgi:molybdopterin/thiamine biosynthesis adenylyltransferase
MEHWTERFPGRLEVEQQAFSNTEGCDFEFDQDLFDETQRVVFRGELRRGDQESVKLEVRYPASFPYLRPEVFAPDLQLPRHQNPYERNLCLLGRSTENWLPSMTGAQLVSERVPYLLEVVERNDPEEMRREEAPQGEPLSTYFRRPDGAAVFIPEEMLHVSTDEITGIARLSIGPSEPALDAGAPILRACLTRLETERNGKAEEIARAPSLLLKRFSKTQYLAGWVRIDSFPVSGEATADELLEAAKKVPGFKMPAPYRAVGTSFRIVGVVCQEEVRQGEFEDAWLFVVEVTETKPNPRAGAYVAKGERLSPEHLGERIPSLKGLSAKTVALAGLGGFGAPIAVELARAQVGEMRVIDHDFVEAGTVVRWPVGIRAVGHVKSQFIGTWLPKDYPFTVVRDISHRIGQVIPPGASEEGPDDLELLADFLHDAHVVVDATAETGIQQLVAAHADAAGIPQVYVSGTPGGFGGLVARVVPGETGCWRCLMLRLEDGSIPPPPFAENGTVQPRGCSDRTWTGSSFDAQPTIAQAVRTICFTALYGRVSVDGVAQDVFRLAQPVDTAGQVLAPDWSSYPLEPHPACGCSVEGNGP